MPRRGTHLRACFLLNPASQFLWEVAVGSQFDRYSSVARSLRAATVSAALLFAASCGDTGVVVPEAGPGRATAALRPNFEKLPSGAPTVPLSKIQAEIGRASCRERV